MSLTNIDITHMLDPFQKNSVFKGVFASDLLPKRFSLPAAFVVNLSTHLSRGSHWIGIFIDTDRNADYFDSFGFPPNQRNIVNFLEAHTNSVKYSKRQFQHIVSNKCGKFVILFVLSKMYGKDVSEVFDKFSSNLTINDLIIENMFGYFKQLRKNLILKK